MEIEYNQLRHNNIADILLVTATDIETKSLLSLFGPVCQDGILIVRKDTHLYNLGIFAGYNVVHCQCTNMGTQEVGSSTLTTARAISDWPSVKAVVMVGIAFGMYNEESDLVKQKFGDVLVAEKIFPYENQRLNPNGDAKYRGKEHFSDKNLVDAFAVIGRMWHEDNYCGEQTSINIVPILTGEKLVDNLEWRNELKQKYPDYKGGEMEGMGIASSSEQAQKPWILVKSICDFADGKKGSTPDEEALKVFKQKTAALLAAKACQQALLQVNVSKIIKDRINFYYRDNEQNIEEVLFLSYKKKNSPYYLVRKVDKSLAPHIMHKHIWVTGTSGIGKSDLLRHALIESDTSFVYIDLSLCDKNDIDGMFQSIYEEVAEHFDEENIVYESFKKTTKDLCELLNTKAAGTTLYLFIEEIPFERNGDDFAEFVRKFASLVIYCSTHISQCTVRFVLSSIAMPKDALDVYKDKIQDYVHFVSMDKWTFEECIDLVNLLSVTLGISWDNEDMKKILIESMDYSPRKLKTALKQCCSLEYGQINLSIVHKLINE